jgi:hypothetical protein
VTVIDLRNLHRLTDIDRTTLAGERQPLVIRASRW